MAAAITFAGPAAAALVARFPALLAGEPTYADLVPVGGKADIDGAASARDRRV